MGILEPLCAERHVQVLACRGYASATAIYDGANRLKAASKRGRKPYILYLGDHDPSGLDMTRDVSERTNLMSGLLHFVDVKRLALNLDQIDDYSPPPNPTKLSDSRAGEYISEYGYDSWELDALEPAVLTNIVSDAILELRDDAKWQAALDDEDEQRQQIYDAATALQAAKE